MLKKWSSPAVGRTGELSILPMQPGDIPTVLKLETGSLSTWSRKQFEDELEQPVGFQFVVRRAGSEKILAFLCGRLMADEAEILKLHVAEYVRREGLGSRLLEFTLSFCKQRGAENCFLELRDSNHGARKLYEKKGFTVAGRRKGYYDQPLEDAVLMERGL